MSEDLTEKQPQNDSEILTAIKRLEDRLMDVSSRMNNVELDQRVFNDAVRRMQMDFMTVNEWLRKLTRDRNQQNSST